MSNSEEYPAAPDDDENSHATTEAASENIIDSRSADPQFIDDLISAVRLKNFLIGRGVEVLPEVVKGMAKLVTSFQSDIEEVDRFSFRRAR